MSSVVTSFKLRELFPIGSGGMGTTHLACMSAMGEFQRFVVVKRLHEHALHDEGSEQRLLAEAQLAGFVHHANVVGVQHVGVDERGLFLVLDFVDGASVRELLRAARPGTIPEPIALRLILDCLAGLQAIHDATDNQGKRLGILHRDVTPDNLLVGLDGVARVSDFGIAKSRYSAVQTAPMRLMGKLPYMAPEYIEGGPMGPAVDVYAAGVSLYWMLAGHSPWPRLEEVQLLAWILSEGVPPLPDRVGPQLREIVAKACAMDPEERYRTAQEMAHALESLGPQHPIAQRLRVAEYLQATVGAASHALRERAAHALGVPSIPPAVGLQQTPVLPLRSSAPSLRSSALSLRSPASQDQCPTRQIRLDDVARQLDVASSGGSSPLDPESDARHVTAQRTSGTFVGATLAHEPALAPTSASIGGRALSVAVIGTVALTLGLSSWVGALDRGPSASQELTWGAAPSPPPAAAPLPSPELARASAETPGGDESVGAPQARRAPTTAPSSGPLASSSPAQATVAPAPPTSGSVTSSPVTSPSVTSSPAVPAPAAPASGRAARPAPALAAPARSAPAVAVSGRAAPAPAAVPSGSPRRGETAGTAGISAPTVPPSGIIKRNPYDAPR